MRSTLPKALQLVFGHEGGYVNVKTDKGGPTKYGITQATLKLYLERDVSINDVKNLTLAEAESIYRKFYWTQAGGDVLPAGLDYAVFDFGLNSGVTRGVKYLQLTLNKHNAYHGEIDGHVGPKTLAAVNAFPGGIFALIRAYISVRMTFLRSLTNPTTGFSKNGRGWTIRVTGIDPKGEWAPQLGVKGHALQLAGYALNVPSYVNSNPAAEESIELFVAKPSQPALLDALKTPEILTGGGVVLTGVSGVVANSSVLQYALAVLMVVGSLYIGYLFIQRLKNNQSNL